MKKGLILVFLLAITLVPSVSAAVCGGAVQCSCEDTLTSDHIMTYDLNCQYQGIEMNTDGVTLDCSGHSIQGPTTIGNGVYLTGGTEFVTIKNCNIKDFGNGIILPNNNQNNIITNNIIFDANSHGVLFLINSSNNTITDNQMTDNPYGIYADTASSYNLIANNEITSDYRGIRLLDSDFNLIYGNVLSNTIENALDNSNNNDWNITNFGNDWDDFQTNPGFPTHYEIPGVGGAIDYIANTSFSYPPNTPDTPMGPSFGIKQIEYTYTASTVDPDGDDVFYMWDFGDGNVTNWIGPHTSGEGVNITYLWETPGTYDVMVKAKDINDFESGWSDSLTVNITEPDTYYFDNTGSEFFKFYGRWKERNYTLAYNGDVRYIKKGIGLGSVAWRVSRTVSPRDYEVYVWKFEHPLQPKFATNAKYAVTDKFGINGWYEVNQSSPGNEWISIGTFSFDSSSNQGVALNDDADGVVIADAIKLVAV
jgi:parallel beta-helix repeat protein